MDGIPIKAKWKIHVLFTLYFKFWRYFLSNFVRDSHQIFNFLLLILGFTLADIILHKFLELHSTLSEKKKYIYIFFITNFPFLTDWMFLCTSSLSRVGLMGYSIFRPHRGMDNQIFKDQYVLERMIVWLINPLELNLCQFDPSEKDNS